MAAPKVVTVTVPNNPVQVLTVQLPGAPGPVGPQGSPGASNVLIIGTVTTRTPGTSATATISGVSPTQVLNLGIPSGLKGDKGDPNTLTIGTVNTLTEGQAATATVTGTAPNQILNLGIPRGYGVRPNGLTGDVLVKLSNVDHDTGWATPDATGLPGAIVSRNSSGQTGFAKVFLNDAPASASEATRKDYVDGLDAARKTYVDNLDAARKTYVDNADATKVSKTGPATIDDSTGGVADHVLTLNGPGTPTGSLLRLQTAGVTTLTLGGYNNAGTYEPLLYNPSAGTGNAIQFGNSNGRLRLLPYNDGATYLQTSQSNLTFSKENAVQGTTLLFDFSATRFTGSVQVAGKITGVTDPTLAQDAATKNYVDGKTWPATSISDSTTTGRSVITAATAAAARTAIGAGTSSLAIGTTNTTAKAGDYQPTSANISDASSIATASMVIKRDAAGRAQVVDPSVAADIATKGYADGLRPKNNGTAVSGLKFASGVANAVFNGTSFAIPTIDYTSAGFTATPMLTATMTLGNDYNTWCGTHSNTATGAWIVARAGVNLTATIPVHWIAIGA